MVPNTEGQDSDAGYGLGWAVQPDVQRFGCCRHAQEVITHTGTATVKYRNTIPFISSSCSSCDNFLYLSMTVIMTLR